VCDADPVKVTFEGKLWIWDARQDNTWTFVSLPADLSDEIRQWSGPRRRGFGSVRVRVTIGRSQWNTSVFPDSASGTYVLPIKRAVRQAEALDVEDVAKLTVELIDP
jgi:hypothetical protein